MENKDNLSTLHHSAAHVLAAAVLEMFPDAKLGIGPAIDDGFYYDFELPRTLIPEDLPLLEEKMRAIIKADYPFERAEMDRRNAEEHFTTAGQPYKVELIKELPDDKATVYKSGNFVDLCKGPHLASTGQIKAFKLLKIAGAYWRGNEKNRMLQRVYGTAFESQKELDAHLKMREEAEKRDHRKIGKKLELFAFSDEIGAGLPLWLPAGAAIREELERWGKETEAKWGYQRVGTPYMTKKKLFEISGHISYFKDEMYQVKVPGDDKEEYYIKPMNCPFHHMIFKTKTRSYKELPLRLAEYGTVARYEQAGALNGILRPRLFCQNDAHIYCAEEQAVDEFARIVDLHRFYYDTLGLKDYYIVLALRDPKKKDKYHGDESMWKKAEELSLAAMEKSGIKYTVENEGAAHYGPKMDFKVKSVIGTEYGISTNQIDLYMPRQFDLKYIDKDGKEKFVVVQHQAPLGSNERFIGFLTEHFAGAFPLWLSPTHAAIIPVSDKFNDYAHKIKAELEKAGWEADRQIRLHLDDSNETVGKKIRNAEGMKTPYMLVVGEKEQAAGTVAVRTREMKEQRVMPRSEFFESLLGQIKERALQLK